MTRFSFAFNQSVFQAFPGVEKRLERGKKNFLAR